MALDAQMIEKIQELVLQGAETEKIGETTYARGRLTPVLTPMVDALHFTTLQGVADYINDGLDGLDDLTHGGKVVVHVMDEASVQVITASLPETGMSRNRFAVGDCAVCEFPFGQFVPQEEFIIKLMAMMGASETKTKLLETLGTLTDEQVSTVIEDGVKQKVTAVAGLAFAENKQLPNPVELKPYRTFREVEQPESPFILRARTDPRQGLVLGLFEADGGAWKIKAVENIAAWIREKVSCKVLA